MPVIQRTADKSIRIDWHCQSAGDGVRAWMKSNAFIEVARFGRSLAVATTNGRRSALIRTCARRWKRLLALPSMVHHIVLYRLKHEVTPARVEEMMMNTRMQLLKIPEVLSIKCGKRIDPEIDWPFFIAIDFESMDKYSIFCEDPIYVKFVEEVIKPNTEDSLVLDFEMDPGKDVRFS